MRVCANSGAEAIAETATTRKAILLAVIIAIQIVPRIISENIRKQQKNQGESLPPDPNCSKVVKVL
jgi:hypothetical protein